MLILHPTIVGAMGSCGEDSGCCEITEITEQQESEQIPEDGCMDLCLCSYCGSSVFFDVNNENEVAFSTSIFSFKSVFTYQSQFSSLFFADIWQPPKLS